MKSIPWLSTSACISRPIPRSCEVLAIAASLLFASIFAVSLACTVIVPPEVTLIGVTVFERTMASASLLTRFEEIATPTASALPPRMAAAFDVDSLLNRAFTVASDVAVTLTSPLALIVESSMMADAFTGVSVPITLSPSNASTVSNSKF